MPKILVAGAGGAPSEGVIKSLLEAGNDVIGMGSEPTDLMLSAAQKKFFVPYANEITYKDRLLDILQLERPDLVHFQNDLEIFHASQLREQIHNLGVKTFLPSHEVIDICVHKYKSWLKFKEAGIIVPENKIIHNPEDLHQAFSKLKNRDGKIWIRYAGIGGGGKGALPTASYEFAKEWISHHNGWGNFVAAEMLTAKTVTWLSIWKNGELIIAQGRSREGWTHGNRTVSGVTGVTKVGVTYSNPTVDKVAIQSIQAIDSLPNGIYGVDMTYDESGHPNPTEINIARFFTTVLFFTKAGINFPKIYVDLALNLDISPIRNKISPLPDGLMWMRGMDCLPVVASKADLATQIIY